MAFHSILHEGAEEPELAPASEERTLTDLNLDQVFEALTKGREEYRLRPLLEQQLASLAAIGYRHRVFRDLERPSTLERVRAFAQGMRQVRARLTTAGKLRYKYQKESWFLDAAQLYCETARGLARDLEGEPVTSEGLGGLRDYLRQYVGSSRFSALAEDVERVRADLSGITYSVHLRGRRITVRRYEGEPDYSAEVEQTFERFKQHQVKDYLVPFNDFPDMNHVEAGILDQVARLFEPEFQALEQFCAQHRSFVDHLVERFDREIQFYLAFLDHAEPLRAAGLSFCYPEVSAEEKRLLARDTFDLALAAKLVAQGREVVLNDLELRDGERILLVTGPNQGGKTTTSRTFGQLHYLARLGYPLPGREARIFLFDRLLTHFGREETLADLTGKLEEELVRIRDILELATPRSVVVLNEIFTSATLKDSIFLGRELMTRLLQLDLLCVWVTFVEELATFAPSVVSMTSTVVPENPAERTFRVVRRPADGLAYAVAIAERHGLTYERLRQRIGA